jgi:hypothetical protein
MNLTFDQNLFTQVGLDSGSLTMLGSIVHSFQEPGEYRGSVHKADSEQAVFYITVDKNSSAAHVNIDLASLKEYSGKAEKDCCDDEKANHFTVNPKGYVLFHVSAGSGGFSVHVRRAEEDPQTKVFNSQELGKGDIFSAVILRPGTYSVSNPLGGGGDDGDDGEDDEREKPKGKAKGSQPAQVVVSYPEMGETPYRPPAPVRVQVRSRGFEPARINLKPAQGLVFDIKTSARIVIELVQPDDGPGVDEPTTRRGWTKNALPKTNA